MAPSWTRYLLFPEQDVMATAPPMWARQSNNQPIFIEPVTAPVAMWSRPGTSYPVFIDAKPSPDDMWNREADVVPMCPCCVSPVSASPPASPIFSRPVTRAARPSTSSGRSLRSMPSTLGLRLKKSFGNLRKKASVQSI